MKIECYKELLLSMWKTQPRPFPGKLPFIQRKTSLMTWLSTSSRFAIFAHPPSSCYSNLAGDDFAQAATPFNPRCLQRWLIAKASIQRSIYYWAAWGSERRCMTCLLAHCRKYIPAIRAKGCRPIAKPGVFMNLNSFLKPQFLQDVT